MRQALLALAYSRGQGLPADVWAHFTSEDVLFIRELAAAFVAEYEEDGHTVYRLYHASLAEALRDEKRNAEMHRFMAERLIAAVPERDWLQADWYTRKYLPHHAEAGGLLDTLMLDTKFLAVADPPELLRVADGVSSDEALRRASWYRLAADRLVTTFDVGERLSYLELTARQHGAVDLADSTKMGPAKPWSASWADWNPETPHIILRGHIGIVNAVAISGDMVASAGQDATVRLWDRRTGKLRVPILSGHEGPVRALAIDDDLVFSGGDDKTVRVWDAGTGKQLEPLGVHPAPITAMAISGALAVSGSEDGTGILWDLFTAKEIYRFLLSTAITAIAMNGLDMAVGTKTGHVIRWNLDDASSTTLFPFGGKVVNSVVIDEDTVLVGGCDSAVRMYDRSSNNQIESDFAVNEGGSVLAVTKDGDLIAVGGTEFLIRCWDRKTGLFLALLHGNDRYVSALAARDGLIASGSWDGTVRLWNARSVRPISYVTQTNERPSNKLAAVATFDGVVATATEWGITRLWSASSGEPIGNAMNQEACFKPYALAVDGEAIMAAGRMLQPFDSETSEIAEGYVSWSDLAGGMNVAGTDFALYRWDRANGSAIRQVIEFEPRPSVLAMTRDLLVVGYADGSIGPVQLIDGLSDPTRQGTLMMHGPAVDALAICGRTVVAGRTDGTVQLWNMDTRAVLETPLQMAGPHALSALGISKRVIVAGNVDGRLQIWDTSSSLVIGTIHVGSPISGIAVDDTAIYVASFRGLVRIDWHRFNLPLGS